MMNYGEFIEVFKSKLMESLPEKFLGWEFTVVKVLKANEIIEELTFRSPNSDGDEVPALPLVDVYQRYQNGVSLNNLVKECLSVLSQCTIKVQFPENKDDFLRIIMPVLVKYDWHLEMLQKVPHRKFLDLAITYRGVLSVSSKEIKDFLVTQSSADRFGVSEDELYSAAIENLKNWGYERRILNDLLNEFLGGDEEVPEMPVSMFILTNKYKMLGSYCLLQNDILLSLAEELKSDLILIPSSVHEILVVPYEGDGIAEFNRMVCDINATELEERDRLSDHVYIYSRKEKRVMKENVYEKS